MLYRILRAIVWVGIRLYYREIKVVNGNVLDQDGPLILIANHPNTLMDAWIMGYINKRRVYFMAKATFFSSPFKKKILGALGMIPINRKSDQSVEGVNNANTFEACYQLLEKGDVLVVFPEGSSFLERRLRDIKSGTARIALETESRNQSKLDLKVIPIGLNYIRADTFRGRVLVHVGKPIDVAPFVRDYENNPSIVAKQLTERFRSDLSRVFVNLDTESNEDLSEQLCAIFDTRYSGSPSGVQSKVAFIQKLKVKLDEIALTSPWKLAEIERSTEQFNQRLEVLGIRPDFLDRPYRRALYMRQVIQSQLFLLICLPFFVFGLLHNALPYWGIGKLVPRISKETEYHAALVVLLGLVCYPIQYIGFCLVSSHFFSLNWIGLGVYLVSMPLLGLFAHFFMQYWRHLASKHYFHRFVAERRDVLKSLVDERKLLNELIFNE